ncbi:sel1 repeat family protein [Sphingomonas parva]|uniref:Sel1 repeat family protein n=1 Tax=Sphingomonas parva TaxID=2555898 RepID=A0A4Y8ZVA9_9SPHN|nr:sel1 repeat family protein [Sphingomonas parva]TFI59854.1 sel1 repeat family protein [Sphingomonas parva]
MSGRRIAGPATPLLLGLAAALLLGGCSVGVKRTPGMKLYSNGDVAAAIPLLEREVAAGEVTARYPLGLAYRDGNGVGKDLDKAEILLTGAAIGGDPRAVTALRQLLQDASRCEKDQMLREHWGTVGTMYRNLITGVVELHTAAPAQLRAMAALYDEPCAGAPPQPEAARSLRALSGGPRHIWIYVPG